jgi:PEP-CTERM motif
MSGRNRLILALHFANVYRIRVALKSTIFKWSWVAGCAFCAGSVFGQALPNASTDTSTIAPLFNPDDFTLTLAAQDPIPAGNSGSLTAGLNVTLASDRSAANGTFDLGSDLGDASLVAFYNDRPSGEWRLFLADLDYGEHGTLTSLGLVVTAVPEPGTMSLLAMGLGGVAGMRWLRRRGN